MSSKPPRSRKQRILLAALSVLCILVACRLTAFLLREQRIEQVEAGMELAEVEALLGQGRPISVFDSELTRCPPERKTVIFRGNPSIVLNGSWEDYIKVGVVNDAVCDVARMSL